VTDLKDFKHQPPLFIGLQAGKNYGWGVCSEYLITELSRLIPVHILNENDGSQYNPNLPGKLFQALTNVNFFPLFEKVRGNENYGYTFFENELTDYSIENAAKYNLILAGSSWCRERLLEKGIKNSKVLIQGVDPKKFYPILRRKPSNNFVIFSGGKFELRKGQDLVLRAFKILQEKYDDIILVNCWYNIWPQSIQLMAGSPHINLPATMTHPWEKFMAAVYEINGLKTDRIKTYELVPNYIMRSIYQGTDIGIFPNRCEGGTNLVMMEYMACAKPVIASNTSGHRDIVTGDNALLLNALKDINFYDRNKKLIARWQEPSLDELVFKIEYAYHHRDEIHQIGQKAGEDMKKFTWQHTANGLVRLLGIAEAHSSK
jgi:glycosyltransferase involved in cell wall biosynthesis